MMLLSSVYEVYYIVNQAYEVLRHIFSKLQMFVIDQKCAINQNVP